jgi:hypothetical protein
MGKVQKEPEEQLMEELNQKENRECTTPDVSSAHKAVEEFTGSKKNRPVLRQLVKLKNRMIQPL